MFKYYLLTTFLLASPIFGLLETLFQSQNDCYAKCDLNHAVGLSNSDACKKGCDYKLYEKNCVIDCKSFSTDERIQNSCLDGCSSSNLVMRKPADEQPLRSIILIRLRQRPLIKPSSLNVESMKMFVDTLRRLNDNRNPIEQSNPIENDSFNNEDTYKVTRYAIHENPNVKSTNNRFKGFLGDMQREWNDIILKQSQIPIWICCVIVFVASMFLLYLIISLDFCVPTILRTLPNRGRTLACDNTYEKEKPTLNDSQFQCVESMPIKF